MTIDDVVAPVPVVLPRTATRAYDFPPLCGCGPHRVFLRVPPGAPPDGGWPVLVTTDGNATFDLAVAAMRTQALDPLESDVAEGVVASIGYPTDALYDQGGRSWDLTPPPGRTYPGLDGTRIRTGGADAFLRFIADEMLPWLSRTAPLSRSRRTLFGHSFGGLFALYALYRRSDLFTAYVAASPSLYWEDEAIKGAEDAFFSGDLASVDARVLLTAGEWEGPTLAPHLRDRADAPDLQARLDAIAKVERASALRRRLDGAGLRNLRCSLEVHAGENHMSVLPVGLSRAVRMAFATG